VNLTISNSIDEKAWRTFVDQHPCGNVFHTPEMIQVFERAKGYRAELWVAVGDAGQVLALFLPVQVTIMDGLLRRLSTRAIAYGSILCTSDDAGHEALSVLLRTYSHEAGHKSLLTELRNLSDMHNIQPVLEKSGFSYEEYLDYLINLDCTPEQLLQNIGSRTRKHIRHGLRKGIVTVKPIIDRNQIRLWYEIIRMSYAAARIPLADLSMFESAFDILQPRGMIRFLVAQIGTTYVAASAELLYKDVIYGWYSGVNRAYADDYPGEMLMWDILEWGVKAGYKRYDFGGAGKPAEVYSVRDFKAKFGGDLVCFGRNTKVHCPGLLRVSGWGYQLYRQLGENIKLVLRKD
jgi:serine/alanine adding enzyme